MAITTATQSFALVVSESPGTVAVFHEGQILLELEKPDATPPRR
jgi:DNA integrity scanning protein DisA with diadenylate cyclase activity